MSLPADKKAKIYPIGDMSGGVNLNDPVNSLNEDQVQDCINVIFTKIGFRRWVGCVALTVQNAITTFFRGLVYSSEISGTGHLFGMWGGKLYEINTSDGTISSEIYNATGSGELSGATHWGKFYGANGNAVFKVEGSTAYRLGIVPPVSCTVAAAAGGSLPDGIYKVKIGYARRVGGLNVLYSQGTDVANVTLGTGNNTISFSGFANSSDAQVGNKIVWMTLAGGSTYYFFHETTDNSTTSFSISSDALYSNAKVYEQFSLPSGLPKLFTGMIIADNKIFGYLSNAIYWSRKASSGYELEQFPSGNTTEYPFQITGIFSIGKYLYINTANNGIIAQSIDDLGAKYEQYEYKNSFKYMNTVVDWNGGKLGITNNGLQFFDGQKFLDFDYSINIRPIIQSMYTTSTSDFSPYACIISRNNRVEYHLTLMNTSVGSSNNNRTYVLNLSQTYYQDNVNYKTPWEIIGRGFNYCAKSASGIWFFGQSNSSGSTIFVEDVNHTSQSGIYNDSGTYLDSSVEMPILVISANKYEHLFSKVELVKIALIMQTTIQPRAGIMIADLVGIESIHDIPVSTSIEWEDTTWEDAVWIVEAPSRYVAKLKNSTRGYTWKFKFEQTADDIIFQLNEIHVLGIIETGRGI